MYDIYVHPRTSKIVFVVTNFENGETYVVDA